VVAIRSEPQGATVFRNGARLGETPISLVVRPSEPFVRVELRLSGYQPLAAELTSKDGERTLKLNKEQKYTRPVRSARAPVVAKGEPKPTEPAPEPSKPSRGPYPRFD
jgi:hypothetical protein